MDADGGVGYPPDASFTFDGSDRLNYDNYHSNDLSGLGTYQSGRPRRSNSQVCVGCVIVLPPVRIYGYCRQASCLTSHRTTPTMKLAVLIKTKSMPTTVLA